MVKRVYMLLTTMLSLYTSLISNTQKHCFSPPKVKTSAVLDVGSVDAEFCRKKKTTCNIHGMYVVIGDSVLCSLFGLTNSRLNVDNSVFIVVDIICI